MTLREFESIYGFLHYGQTVTILYNGRFFDVLDTDTQERLIAIWDNSIEEKMWLRYENSVLMPENLNDLDKAKQESKRLLLQFMAS